MTTSEIRRFFSKPCPVIRRKIPSTCQGQRNGRQVEGKRHHNLDRVPAGSNERTRFDERRLGIAWLIWHN